jgi:hypothetical protein
MLDHATFSALRLGRVFPAAVLDDYPFYTALRPGGSFDTEYMGGQWHEELIDGVQFFYPRRAADKLGMVELWGSGCVAAAARDKPAAADAAPVPAWVANADRVLAALDLPVRMGADEAAVRALAAGRVQGFDYPAGAEPKGTIRSLSFAVRAPDAYHVAAVVHAANGLLKLEIRRPDLVRRNDPEGAYDACFAALHDEGSGG